MNANKGHAAGVEVELRKTLSPAWRFGLNAAYMFTRVSLPEEGVYTDKQRALQGASPFLGNADVTFTPELKGRRNLTLALLYNLQGRVSTPSVSTGSGTWKNRRATRWISMLIMPLATVLR